MSTLYLGLQLKVNNRSKGGKKHEFMDPSSETSVTVYFYQTKGYIDWNGKYKNKKK